MRYSVTPRLLPLLVATCVLLGSGVSQAAARSDQGCDEDPNDGRFFTEAVGTSISQSFTPGRSTISGFDIAVANINPTPWRGTLGAEVVLQSPGVDGFAVVLTRLAAISPRPVVIPSRRRTWLRFDLATPLSVPPAGMPAIRVAVPAGASGTGLPPWAWIRCSGSYSRGAATVPPIASVDPAGAAGASAQVELPHDTQFRTY